MSAIAKFWRIVYENNRLLGETTAEYNSWLYDFYNWTQRKRGE